MNHDDALARQVSRGVRFTLLWLGCTYVGAISLAPWERLNNVHAKLLLLLGLTVAALSHNLRTIGSLSTAIQRPFRWIKPVSTISSALGVGMILLGVAYLLL